jgi:hypothetical protein
VQESRANHQLWSKGIRPGVHIFGNVLQEDHMMQLKALAAAAVLGLASASSFAVDTVVTLSGGTVGAGTFGATRTGAFNDNFTFTTGPVTSFFSSSVTSINLMGQQDLTFSNVSLRTGAGFGTTVATFAVAQSGAIELRVLPAEVGINPNPTLLANTVYAIHVEGTSSGGIGAYAGTLNVIPVPEPGTYALMLAGLGCVGFLARRRQSA